MTVYNISPSDLSNCVTQCGYLQASIVAAEGRSGIPTRQQLDLTHIHNLANTLAVIAARSMGLADNYFGGSSANMGPGTAPSSGGSNK